MENILKMAQYSIILINLYVPTSHINLEWFWNFKEYSSIYLIDIRLDRGIFSIGFVSNKLSFLITLAKLASRQKLSPSVLDYQWRKFHVFIKIYNKTSWLGFPSTNMEFVFLITYTATRESFNIGNGSGFLHQARHLIQHMFSWKMALL